jgi:hypothetical protein
VKVQARKPQIAVVLAQYIVNGKNGQNMALAQKSVAQVKRSALEAPLRMPLMVVSHVKGQRRRLKIAMKKNAQSTATSPIGSRFQIAVSLVGVVSIKRSGQSISKLSLVARNALLIYIATCLVI